MNICQVRTPFDGGFFRIFHVLEEVPVVAFAPHVKYRIFSYGIAYSEYDFFCVGLGTQYFQHVKHLNSVLQYFFPTQCTFEYILWRCTRVPFTIVWQA